MKALLLGILSLASATAHADTAHFIYDCSAYNELKVKVIHVSNDGVLKVLDWAVVLSASNCQSLADRLNSK